MIDFQAANLANADLSGSKLTADGTSYDIINFRAANLSNADLSGVDLNATMIILP